MKIQMEFRLKNGNIIPKLTLLSVQYLIQNCSIISFIPKLGYPGFFGEQLRSNSPLDGAKSFFVQFL